MLGAAGYVRTASSPVHMQMPRGCFHSSHRHITPFSTRLVTPGIPHQSLQESLGKQVQLPPSGVLRHPLLVPALVVGVDSNFQR